MMKVRKTISLLLVLAVIIGLFAFSMPVSGAAEGEPEEEDRGFVWNKNIVYNDDGTYTIEMDAYAKGVTVITTTEVTLPCDIVLVLDTSGSMDENISGSGVLAPSTQSISMDDLNDDGYYYKWTDGQYYQIKGIANQHDWYYNFRTWAYFDVGADRYYLSGNEVIKATNQSNPTYDGSNGSYPYRADAPDTKIDCHEMKSTTIFTNTVYSYEKTKLAALKSAACDFLDVIYQDAVDNEVDHKVAIVEFASKSYRKAELTSITGENALSNLKGIINAFSAGGATAADLGMSDAESILSSARKDSSKSVVLFTDGAPTHGNTNDDFSGDSEAIGVATDTIKISGRLKTGGASVYTVGAFSSETDSIKKYLNGVSSNHPNAESYYSLGEGSDRGFYMITDSASGLSTMFKKIAQQTVSGKSAVVLSTKAVLTDVVSDFFYIPDGVKSVSAFTADYDAATGTFGTKKPFSDAVINVSGNTVTVTGFDYTSHWCGEGATNGQKLVVDVIIKPKDGVDITDSSVFSNLPGSGISDPESGVDFPFEQPEVTPKTVTYKLVDSDGKKIADDVTDLHLPGTNVSKNAPVVHGYTPTEAKKEFFMLNRDMEFTFTYTIDTYTITYDSKGGSAVEPVNYKVTDTVTLAKAPTKEGYSFKSWSNGTESGSWTKGTYDAQKDMKTGNYGNVTLEALWEENTATITYMIVGGEGTTPWGSVKLNTEGAVPGNTASETVGVVTGTPGATAAAASEEYVFAGWYDNALGEGSPVSTSAGFSPAKSGKLYTDKTYYAIFKPHTTTLTVERKGLKSGENAVIRITGKGIEGGLILTIPGDSGSITISGIEVGQEYTVEELHWSNTDGDSELKSITTVSDGSKNIVTLTKQGKISKWLREEATVKNIFGKKA